MRILLLLVFVIGVVAPEASRATPHGQSPRVDVKAEENVYTFVNPDNGSGPLWAYGSTQIARLGDQVFVCQMETGAGIPPLSNTRWRLLKRAPDGWRLVAEPDGYSQREPCLAAVTSRTDLFLSVNDSTQPSGTKYGACDPHVLRFRITAKGADQAKIVPSWTGKPHFTDHSYRGFAADRRAKRLLMLNIDATTSVQNACLLSADGKTLANAAIRFPIRACYPQVALRKGAAYVLAIGDIVEPVKEWREYKFEQTKRAWDYVFRILYYTWSPDLKQEGFADPIEIANVDKTGGHITNQDLWISPQGEAYILYTEQEVQSALLRDKFFSGRSIIPSLCLAVVKDDAVVSRRTLIAGTDTMQAGCARFQETKNGALYAVVYVTGSDAGNKLMPIYPPVENPPLVPVPLKKPFTGFCLANVRAGNAPSDTIDMLGQTADNTMSYAQVALSPAQR
jgi:hypothetical protein